MMPQKEETPEVQPEEEQSIQVHSIETDLKLLNSQEESMQEPMTTETTEVDEPTDVEDKQKEEAKEEPKKKSRTQRKIEKQARELKELREFKDSHQDSEDKPGNEDAPDVDDFETFEEYEEALAEHEAPKVEEKKEEPQNREMKEKVDELFEYGAEDYDDFDELVGAEDLAISQDMLASIVDSDNPTDLAYYLATHKDEAREIAGLGQRAMNKRLFKIELTLDKTTTKQVRTSNAPKPITPVTGSSATSKSLNDENLSFEEHEALLNSQKAKSAGGFI